MNKRFFFGCNQLQLYISFLKFYDAFFHPSSKSRSQYIVYLHGTLYRHLFVCANSIDNKNDSGFLGLDKHNVCCGVEWFDFGRSQLRRKVARAVVWPAQWWITLARLYIRNSYIYIERLFSIHLFP